MIRHKVRETAAALLLSVSAFVPAVCEDAKTTPSNSANTSTTSSSVKAPENKLDSNPKSTATTSSSTETTTTTSPLPSAPPKPSSASDLPDHITPSWATPSAVPAKIIPEKPKEKPAPAAQAAAVKLYTAGKFAPAAAQFEKFIKDGSANVDTHAYLAYCEYRQRHYTKAIRQFDWVAKNTPDNYKLRTSAEKSSALLRSQMSGICPNQCLKPNDPRWQRDGNGQRMIKWSITDGWAGVSDQHMGQIVVFRNGTIVNLGTCPTCGGTGTVQPLRDGDPVPK